MNRKHLEMLVLAALLIGTFGTYCVGSSLMSSYVINNTGQVYTGGSIEVTANSGSIADIQAAINLVAAAGGGTVHIPAGNFTFNPPAGRAGVTVYAGVNLVGAGMNQTWLIETQSTNSTMMVADGRYDHAGHMLTKNTQKPIVIEGISFLGFVPSVSNAETVVEKSTGLAVTCVKDFVVYDCSFLNFVSCGITTNENDGHSPPLFWLRGVISHCVFDQPYKDDYNIASRIWGYGIICSGSNVGSDSPLSDKTWGQYDTVPFPADLTYIEDCNFSRCRHSVSGTVNFGAHYVVRYCNFYQEACDGYGAYIDMHPGDIHESVEAYGNTLYGLPVGIRDITTYNGSYSPNTLGAWITKGIILRGGSGLIYDNTIIDCARIGVGLTIDDPSTPTDYVWIWGNIITYPNSGSGTSIDLDSVAHAYLRAPNQQQDGFTYTPYPYPHPLLSILIH